MAYGPVSVPPRPVVVFAAILIIGVGLSGAVFGFRAAWRGGAQSPLGSPESTQDAQAIDAKPIVDLPPVTAPTAAAATNTVVTRKAAPPPDDTNAIAAKVAQAEAAQSKPAQKQPNIDDMMASPSEKPQAPAKPSVDEQAPATPSKTDVPF